MQASSVSPPSAQVSKWAYGLAVAGSALTIISFFVIPFISISYSSSYLSPSFTLYVTLAQILDLLNIVGQSLNFTSTFSTAGQAAAAQVSAAFACILIAILIAAAAAIMSIIFLVRSKFTHIAGAVSLIILGVIDAGLFLYLIVGVSSLTSTSNSRMFSVPGLSSSSSSVSISIGAGGWLCLLGAVLVLVSGIVAVVRRPMYATPMVYGPGVVAVPNQYVPSQSMYSGYPVQAVPPSGYPSQPVSSDYSPQSGQAYYPQAPSGFDYPSPPASPPQA
jgi:hypothetical protein